MYALSFFGDMLNMFAVIQYFSKIVSVLLQARRQEMKWGWVFFVKWKMGFFVKKVDLSSTQGALRTESVFFILHFTYLGGAYAPPAYGPVLL